MEALMTVKTGIVVLFALFAGPAIAAPSPGGIAATTDGLVAVQSRTLDEVYVRPNADLSSYRKVMIDPGTAELRKNWLKDTNSQRSPARWITRSDAQEITDQAAKSLAPALAEVFKRQGYEIVTAPGPGVLRLSPSVTDLYVNAPYFPTPGIQKANVRDAGEATLRLDVRDAVSGALLARIIDSSTAQEIRAPATAAGQLAANPANDVTNQFWFDALYRQFGSYCWKVIGAAPAAATAKAQP
jgi:hypothetical protein